MPAVVLDWAARYRTDDGNPVREGHGLSEEVPGADRLKRVGCLPRLITLS